MMELPEAITMAGQLNETVTGKTMTALEAGKSPHKFAFFSKPTEEYPPLFVGRRFTGAESMGMFVRLDADDASMLFGDGVRLRYYPPGEALPEKHQLLIRFEDGSALVASVQMYGGMWAMVKGECYGNPYYLTALEKPSPLSDAFDLAYFRSLAEGVKPNLSAKAFLATEQRIPGLGNGALQDILFHARIHPKKKLEQLDGAAMATLFEKVKGGLAEMTRLGGRDTEKDLYGAPGGYHVLLNAKAAGAPCPVCGAPIEKQAYLGGTVYYCPVCQPL